MRAVIVFDSMFGNTRQVAQAIAEGLATRGTVDLLPVDDAPYASLMISHCWWSAGPLTPTG